ncbi:YncE family protein [Haliangium sp.]|uniref:YncE family protein n=1 Tax=Haliangium sp. TaxID=2663208 RepID=UPI003D0F1251
MAHLLPPPIRPGRPARRARVPLLVALAAALAGCPAAGDDVRPPSTQFYYPTALAASPDGAALFVVNANADLLYNTGSVVVVDLVAVDALVADPAAGGCAPAYEQPAVRECDEAGVITGSRGVRIGNFASAAAVQALADGALRLFVTVRGDPSVTWIDYRDGELSCAGGEEIPLCDDDNRVTRFRDDPDLPPLTAEPFGIYVDSDNHYAVVTHLIEAAISLIHTPEDGPPVLADKLNGVFTPNGNVQSALGVAGRRGAGDSDLVYVTSRSDTRVQTLYVEPNVAGSLPRFALGDYFFLDSVSPNGDLRDVRGISFNADGTRAYIVNRSPPMLHVIDTATGADGTPTNEVVANVEMCRDAANVVVTDPGQGERAYVSCFPAGQVWVVDPDLGTVEDIITVGSGPHSMTLDPSRKRLYVGNYLDDTVAVVDIDPTSATGNQVVLRLGSPKQRGEEY